MKRAIQITPVSAEFMAALDGKPLLLPLPPVPWYVRGPRGGVYLATGERERRVGETADDFMRNRVTVMDRSEGVKRVRKGTRAYREATRTWA